MPTPVAECLWLAQMEPLQLVDDRPLQPHLLLCKIGFGTEDVSERAFHSSDTLPQSQTLRLRGGGGVIAGCEDVPLRPAMRRRFTSGWSVDNVCNHPKPFLTRGWLLDKPVDTTAV